MMRDESFSKQSIGKLGENYAADYLKKKGYRILRRNYRCKLGEIDFIARDQSAFVFIEVKTRSNLDFGEPEEAVGGKKRKKLIQVAQWFLNEIGEEDPEIRLDVVSVLLDGRGFPSEIRHFEGALEA